MSFFMGEPPGNLNIQDTHSPPSYNAGKPMSIM